MRSDTTPSTLAAVPRRGSIRGRSFTADRFPLTVIKQGRNNAAARLGDDLTSHLQTCKTPQQHWRRVLTVASYVHDLGVEAGPPTGHVVPERAVFGCIRRCKSLEEHRTGMRTAWHTYVGWAAEP